MQHLLKRVPQVKIIDPVDDNLFVNRKRVEDICKGILERGLNVVVKALGRPHRPAGRGALRDHHTIR